MLATDVLQSPFPATLREPETSVSNNRRSLASSLTTKLLTHSTKTQTSNMSSPVLGCSTTQLVAPLQKIFGLLFIERHTGQQVSDDRLVARSRFCDQLFHHRDQLRCLLAYDNSLLSNGRREFRCTSFCFQHAQVDSSVHQHFQSCWSTRYERGSLLNVQFSLVPCFVFWRKMFHLQWNCISARPAGSIAQRLKIDLVLRCVSLSLKSLRVHFLGRIPCARKRHLVLSALWLD